METALPRCLVKYDGGCDGDFQALDRASMGIYGFIRRRDFVSFQSCSFRAMTGASLCPVTSIARAEEKSRRDDVTMPCAPHHARSIGKLRAFQQRQAKVEPSRRAAL